MRLISRSPSLLVVLALCVPGGALTAQQVAPSDTTPFRRGQWALQFAVGANFGSLGALKFTTPRSAWLVDLQFNGNHSHERFPVAPDSVVEQFSSTAQFTTRVGKRVHQAHRVVASYETVGILGGFSHDCSGGTAFPLGSFCSNGWTAGAFGDIGAIYLPTPHLSLGGAFGVSFAYARSKHTAPGQPAATFWSYRASLGTLSMNATLYF